MALLEIIHRAKHWKFDIGAVSSLYLIMIWLIEIGNVYFKICDDKSPTTLSLQTYIIFQDDCEHNI